MTWRVLLGPQRLHPTVGAACAELGIRGRTAVISAGWQEREGEDERLVAALGLPTCNLRLYQRWEAMAESAPELFSAHRARQDQLRALEELYDARLRHFVAAARDMLVETGPSALVEPERADAIDALRRLDEHHLARIDAIKATWRAAARPLEHPEVQRQRAEVRAMLDDCDVVAVAGGHVGVLLNRLQIFGIADAVRGKHLLAWSAGAMAMCERILLFHDHPPQGPGNAEVYERGQGLVRGVIALPHARRRLNLEDPVRVSLLARRLAPDRPMTLDDGSWAAFAVDAQGACGGKPAIAHEVRVLCASGRACERLDAFDGVEDAPPDAPLAAALPPALAPVPRRRPSRRSGPFVVGGEA